MKVRLCMEEFESHAKNLARFARRPKGDNIILYTAGNMLCMEAKVQENLRMHLEMTPLEIIEEGICSVPYNRVMDYCTEDTFTCLNSQIAYPLSYFEGKTFLATVPYHVLKRVYTTIGFSTGKDDLRPVLQGIGFDEENAISTDTHRMSVMKHDLVIPEGVEFVIHNKMIEYALKHKNDITVFMHEDKEKARYYYSYVLGSNAIGSFETVQFPNYRRILNYEETLSIRFNRKAFIDSLKNVVVGEKNMVRFSINDNKFVLQGEDYDNTVEVTEWSCTISKFSGAVNKIYLLEALNAFDTQHVEWKWQKVSNLSCTELVDEKSELRHVLMPMNPEYV